VADQVAHNFPAIICAPAQAYFASDGAQIAHVWLPPAPLRRYRRRIRESTLILIKANAAFHSTQLNSA
jgi:hypothetical protein